MEIQVIESTKTKLVFALPGQGHTLCNSLKHELNKNPKVNSAGYFIDHPLTGVPQFILETSGVTPKDALTAAVKDLVKNNDKFLKGFTKEAK